MHLHEIQVHTRDPAALREAAGEAAVARLAELARRIVAELDGNAIWNVNSTAVGGGVAEMLGPLIGYARGLGVDARWVVLEGNPGFFHVTKRLHHALHGSSGDGSPLGDAERRIYEGTLATNAVELLARIQPGDVVLLHDPQTTGLAPALERAGAHVIWRCHIGSDEASEEALRGWAFLEPYLSAIPKYVFSRRAYVPPQCDHGKAVIIQPSIDALSPKNQVLSREGVLAILAHVGILEGRVATEQLGFVRSDGSPGRVEHKADLIRMGSAPAPDVPLVVQVSRWDPLKDPRGVIAGFVRAVERIVEPVELVLAGPSVHAVADDPEADDVFLDVLRAWRELPHAMRDRVTLASLPMHDPEENAAIVNALQRHATVVVQKSLREGFGLTVTEAMWKGRAVVASGIGGIQDQIEDGRSGILLADPRDEDAFANALVHLLSDGELRASLGRAARERVRAHFLGTRHLMDYAALVLEVLPKRGAARSIRH